jgi:hypothetical protein
VNERRDFIAWFDRIWQLSKNVDRRTIRRNSPFDRADKKLSGLDAEAEMMVEVDREIY